MRMALYNIYYNSVISTYVLGGKQWVWWDAQSNLVTCKNARSNIVRFLVEMGKKSKGIVKKNLKIERDAIHLPNSP